MDPAAQRVAQVTLQGMVARQAGVADERDGLLGDGDDVARDDDLREPPGAAAQIRAERAGRSTGLAKVVVARNVITVTEQAVALIGNAGLTRHNPLQRHLRDALCSRIHSPQDDTILPNAGRAALERGG